jgi:thiol-disulfide isomerase/thioredoxin
MSMLTIPKLGDQVMKKFLAMIGVAAMLAAAVAIAQTASAADDAAGAAPAASGSQAADDESFDIGDPAPAWKDLIGVDDQTHSLNDLADAKAVVVVFTCNHCPVAKAYEDRIVQLAADYADKGVELVAINVNNMDADKLPAMKQRAEEKGFKFTYLYDPTQAIGRSFGATVTPHVFLLDGQRRLAYMGAIDDSMDAEKVTQHYLRDAIDAVLAGNAPAVATTQQVGCGIQYE